MRKLLFVTLVLAPVAAVADPAPERNDTPAAPPFVSPAEPGTLARGQIGLRAGAGIGNGPLGLGGEAVVGLGGVDVMASAGYVPSYCVSLGELGGGCDEALVILGVGMQAGIQGEGSLRLGGRVKADKSVRGDDTSLVAGGVQASFGVAQLRGSLGITALDYYETGDPFGHNGWYVGPELGVQYLRSEHTGLSVSLGYGLPLDHQDKGMVMGSATFLLY
jgi:hypothetical protein